MPAPDPELLWPFAGLEPGLCSILRRRERESYNSWLSILSDTETGLAISGRVTQARHRSADTDTATDWREGRGEGQTSFIAITGVS